jgi:tRNA(fMet)-specific endonuclease VapC
LNLKYLLDTSTLSAVIAAKPSRAVLNRLGQRGPQCAIASVVWNELVYGWHRLPEGKRKSELDAFLHDVVLKSFPVLAYGEEAAIWHGLERARQERVGRPGPYVDGQIAAIAHVNGLILVTANVCDFARFKNIVAEDWTRARAQG